MLSASGVKSIAIVMLLMQALTVGTFFAFSTFVMSALNRLGAETAIRSMQSINSTILGSPFMVAFGLSTLLALALPIVDRAGSGAWNLMLVVCAAVYVVGLFGTTALGNVPLNDALARAKAIDEGAWRTYYGGWMLWNHVRTLAGVASIVGLSVWMKSR